MHNSTYKLVKFSIFCLLFMASGLLFGKNAYADTIIDHNIAHNTHWTKAGSPYNIRCNAGHKIVVNENATLTIDPGVTVKFEPRCGLEVVGKIKAIGLRDQRITFTSIYDNGAHDIDTAHPGDWFGIAVLGEGSVLKYTHIKYAGYPDFNGYLEPASLYLSGHWHELTNSVIEKGAGNGVWLKHFFLSKVHNNLVQDHKFNGIITTRGISDIFHNIIQNNGESGLVIDSQTDIHGNFIQRNGRNGIHLNTLKAPNIHDNDIHHNQENGIEIEKGYPRIHHNAINANNNGVMVKHNWPLEIQYNDFLNNRSFGMRICSFSPKYTQVKGQNNWWGGTGGPLNNPENNSVDEHIAFQPWLSKSVSKFFTNQIFNLDQPNTPKTFHGYSDDEKVFLYWQDSTDDDFFAYHIYKSPTKNGRYERIASTNLNYFVDHNFDLGKTYYYKISAVDFSGNESQLSKAIEIKFTSRQLASYSYALIN